MPPQSRLLRKNLLLLAGPGRFSVDRVVFGEKAPDAPIQIERKQNNEPENKRWGARPPRASLDAPRVQSPWRLAEGTIAERVHRVRVFPEGAENSARGGCAPVSTRVFGMKTTNNRRRRIHALR